MEQKIEEDKDIQRKSLIEKYWEQGMSLREIGKPQGVGHGYTYKLFKKLGIRTRTISESMKLKHKKVRAKRRERAKLIQNQKVFIPEVQENQ